MRGFFTFKCGVYSKAAHLWAAPVPKEVVEVFGTMDSVLTSVQIKSPEYDEV